MNKYLEEENRKRVTLTKDPLEEEFIKDLNSSLMGLEEKLSRAGGSALPNIYIFGLPRSGTTVLYQLLAQLLDVAWPTNLMARFWETPLVGMQLSKTLKLFDEPYDIKSIFGVTAGASAPHEFGYFWMKWLNYSDNTLRGAEHEETIDWNGLKKKLASITAVAGRSMLYKNILPSFHLKKMIESQPDSVFIYCKRDLADIATSILKTRETLYGDRNTWWSIKPPDYKEHLKDDAYIQIAYQIRFFDSFFTDTVSSLKTDNVLQIDYGSGLEELVDGICNKVSTIQKKIQKDSMLRFEPRTHIGTPEYKRFDELLANLK